VAKYRADVDEPRYYPDLGLSVNPADEVDLPDGIVAVGLTPIDAPAKSKKSTTVETPAPDVTTSDAIASEDAPAQGVTN
jgi:hypothetical protein